MWPFPKRHVKGWPRGVVPLFGSEFEVPPEVRSDLLATKYLPTSTGVKMMMCDAANQVLRHCRIGLVRPKARP